MNKTMNTLKIRGIHTPHLFLWMKGALDGKIFHTGGIDPIRGVLFSSYITGQMARFQTAYAKRIAIADKRMKPFWTEADHLLIDYANLPEISKVAEHDSKVDSGNGATIRAYEKVKKMKASYETKRINIIKRLTDISNNILAECVQLEQEIETAEKQLSSNLASYGHGLTFKPVENHMLPIIDKKEYGADKLYKFHEGTWKAMTSIIKGEMKNDVV